MICGSCGCTIIDKKMGKEKGIKTEDNYYLILYMP